MTAPGTLFTGPFRLVGKPSGKAGWLRWQVLRFQPGPGPATWVEVATTVLEGRKAATGRAWAANTLCGHQVRVVSWYPTPEARGRDFTASTAAWFRQWQVTTYEGVSPKGRWRYRATADGWQRSDGVRYRNLDDVRLRDDVDLTPVDVSSVPAVLAELGVWRAVAGSWEGSRDCWDGDCDDYDDQGQLLPGLVGPYCSHITPVIAATGQVRALHRVDAVLGDLFEAAKADQPAGTFLDGVRHTHDMIRAAMMSWTDDDEED